MKTKNFVATREWPESSWQTDMTFHAEAIDAGKIRGKMNHSGPWHVISEYKALAVEFTGRVTAHYGEYPNVAIIHGERSRTFHKILRKAGL
jgi:hypothetical protein